MKTIVFCLSVLFVMAGCGPEIDSSTTFDAKNHLTQTLPQQNLVYKNEHFSFGFKQFPKDFEVQYLDNEAGLIFKKAVVPPPSNNPKDPAFNYNAEIYLMPFENFEDFASISDFVGKKYAGYSFEFADYGDFNGYYVNEGVALNAVSHFFTLGKGTEIIYEVYLKVPSKYYSAQKEIFENLVKNFVFL